MWVAYHAPYEQSVMVVMTRRLCHWWWCPRAGCRRPDRLCLPHLVRILLPSPPPPLLPLSRMMVLVELVMCGHFVNLILMRMITEARRKEGDW